MNKIHALVFLCLLFVMGCGPKKIKQQSYEEQLDQLERLSLNLDQADDNPMLRGAILSVIMFNSHDIEACYQKVSKNNPKITGKIKTFFTIGHNGKMRAFKVKENTMNNPKIEECVEQAFAKMDFPPTDKLIDVTHSIKFSPAE
jgi:hypothetical protein